LKVWYAFHYIKHTCHEEHRTMPGTHSDAPTSWPYWSLFFCGHFGSVTPASRRLHRESLVGLMLLGTATLGTVLLGPVSPYGKLIFIPAVTLSVAWILLAYRRYFANLDELSLRIQHEAIAFSFAVTLLLGVAASAAAVVTHISVHPLWIVIAEPLRGLGLVLAARRYR
jgi:hypothetical protein